MVPLRARVHTSPAHLVDEVTLRDLSKEGIIPEHTCDFHAEDWWGSVVMETSYRIHYSRLQARRTNTKTLLLSTWQLSKQYNGR